MTRKDFVLIASVFRTETDYLKAGEDLDSDHQLAAVERLAEDMADKLATTNANFDRVRFLKACGVY